jgi:hypothetical protein
MCVPVNFVNARRCETWTVQTFRVETDMKDVARTSLLLKNFVLYQIFRTYLGNRYCSSSSSCVIYVGHGQDIVNALRISFCARCVGLA